MRRTYYISLSIAGSDSCGGAGIQADLKTFSALGVYGMSVVTAITAQNTLGVYDIMAVSPSVVRKQIEAVFDDMRPDSLKIGMLFNSDIIEEVSYSLSSYKANNIVLDPVMISTSGSQLLENNAIEAMVRELFPIADLVTPNKYEAEYISGKKIVSTDDVLYCGHRILDLGAKAVLIKGGHFDDDIMTDYLFFSKNQAPEKFSMQRVATINSHGTGCTLSSAIAAYLAQGYSMTSAVSQAKKYLNMALSYGADIYSGKGHGPVNHFFEPQKLKIKEI